MSAIILDNVIIVSFWANVVYLKPNEMSHNSGRHCLKFVLRYHVSDVGG